MKNKIKKFFTFLVVRLRHVIMNRQSRNSLILMFNSALTAFAGFIFWMIASRKYSPETIGICTSLIAAITLASTISLLGLDSVLMRFLPELKKKDKEIRLISKCFAGSLLLSLIVAVIFLFNHEQLSPVLTIIKTNSIYGIIFLASIIVWTIYQMAEAMFIGLRIPHFNTGSALIFSLIKIILLFVLLPFALAGILSGIYIAALVSILLILLPFIFTNYRKIKSAPKLETYGVIKYAASTYIVKLFIGLPVMAMPFIVGNYLEVSNVAYFYMASMIYGIVSIIPVASAMSLNTEAASDKENFQNLFLQSLKMIFIILIPAVMAILVFGKYVLLFFGKEYSVYGHALLSLMALSSLFLAMKRLIGVTFNLNKDFLKIIVSGILDTVMILGLTSLFLLRNPTLISIGFAFLFGEIILLIINLLMALPDIKKLFAKNQTYKYLNIKKL